MIGRIVATQQHFHRRDEFIRHRADTPVGQFNDVVFAACFNPAALQNITIDAQITKLMISAMRLPLAFSSMCRISVVLPAPRKTSNNGRSWSVSL
jgi:hypothetical protein